MAWRIEFARDAERELNALDPQVARRILKFLNERIASLDDQRSLGEALKGSRLGAFWKYRVGDWRLIASIDDGILCILVLRIGNHREVYRHWLRPSQTVLTWLRPRRATRAEVLELRDCKTVSDPELTPNPRSSALSCKNS